MKKNILKEREKQEGVTQGRNTLNHTVSRAVATFRLVVLCRCHEIFHLSRGLRTKP